MPNCGAGRLLCQPTLSMPGLPGPTLTAATSHHIAPCWMHLSRQYLKHRAHALTHPKSKGRAAAGGSPTIQVDARG